MFDRERGERGERGKQGDHGQHGDKGVPGKKGDTGRTAGVGLFVVTALAITGIAYFGQSWMRNQLSDNSIKACERGVLDRRVAVKESLAGNVANMIIATDPKQPKRTRDARRVQAKANMDAAVSRETRIPLKFRVTVEGKRAPQFTCEAAFK